MRAFLGLVMAMGIVKKPSIESYWETSGITETENFRDAMPRNRFQSIIRYTCIAVTIKQLSQEDKQDMILYIKYPRLLISSMKYLRKIIG
jgi:hypothetical protein